MMKEKKFTAVILAIVTVIVIGAAYYYVELPAINIHAPGFWKFIIVLMVIITVAYCVFNATFTEKYKTFKNRQMKSHKLVFRTGTAKIVGNGLIIATLAIVIIYIAGSILSSEIINASAYQRLLKVENRDFTEDIKEVSYDKIPILDKDSASTIGNRVMGTIVDMVSQFEVSDMYSQINYNNKPVRVSPLQYGNLIKWFTNHSSGIPAYISIDMTTQQAECVRLSEPIKYSKSDHFGRNIYRHLRFAYPAYIFDDVNFEIDDNGTPYWICPVKKYNIGLFGGVTIGRVVLCNAITGELNDYAVEDVPQWVDKVYSADMLINLYNYSGKLKHGYFNSVLSQKDCLKTTDGYNYIALDDDVWVYTGITSVGQDKSNVGFVLMNQRTMESRYYEISGAEEYSAMSSAEGKVQNLSYKATFPLLLNVDNEPTYFMALKDSAGLVKSYAMLNIEKYQNVAIGDTVAQCEENYRRLLSDNGITQEEQKTKMSTMGSISKMIQAVTDGNSHYYIMLDGSDKIYDILLSDNIDIIRYNIGDTIKLEYYEDNNIYVVTSVKKGEEPYTDKASK